MDASTLLVIAIVIGALVGPALVLLLIGDQWAKRSPTQHGDFFATLHLLAIAAAIGGTAVSWMSFASDHPKKWLHLVIPVVFVAIVYGYALRFNREAWISLARDLRERVRGSDAD